LKKILAVDDEIDLLDLMKKYLEDTGNYIVNTTSIPEDVERLCLQDKPDLIILDIVMPQMSGTEVIRILKDNPSTRNIRIIVTSGGGEMVYVKEEDNWSWQPNQDLVLEQDGFVKESSHSKAAEAYGVDDFLSKPFPPAFLLQVVEEILQKPQA